uniref:Hsp20/alpha crystallin family protein n=1 Tax=candidate division CPR3 bacterium TaxID=2268181 RepID=A0A7C4M5T0_UNCC3
MSLIPWKPFADMDKFFSEEDWLMPVFPKMDIIKPAMDVKENEKEIVAELEIPGFDPEKIDISVEDGVLRVKGVLDEKKEEKDKGYWRKEIRTGSFERMIRLPVEVKENEVAAVYEKGILKINMPKAKPKELSKKIKVQIKGK